MSSQDIVVRFRGRVDSLDREIIPKLYLGRIVGVDGDYVLEADLHEDLFLVNPGEEVEVEVSRVLPSYREGVDFVGRATVASARESGGWHEYLLSVGGLLMILRSRETLSLKPTEKVYVKIAPR